jgi:hypothetical protein
MSTGQRDRVHTVLRQLHETEHERRLVATSGAKPDAARHSDLANQVRELIGGLSTADVRSLALRMVVDSLNGSMWPRCDGCGRPTYLGEAKP